MEKKNANKSWQKLDADEEPIPEQNNDKIKNEDKKPEK